MNYLARLLRVMLDVVSPSVLALVQRTDPPARSWLVRRERALALRVLGDRLSMAEQALEDATAVGRYAEAVERLLAEPEAKGAAR